MAGEEYESGVAVADEVDEWSVGGDGELRCGRARRCEPEPGGCGWDGASFVDRDVSGVPGRVEGRARGDLRARPRGGADVGEAIEQVDLVVVVPLNR